MSEPAGSFLRRRRTCRGCGADDLVGFLSLGPTPLANAFLESREAVEHEHWFPLDVHFCRKCSLVQLLDVVDPEVLFSDYLYLSGTSDTIGQHNRELADDLVERCGLEPDDLVVEIGSNDGSLLGHFLDRGVRVLGVEPASNLAERARAAGIDTVSRFFERQVAAEIADEHGLASVVVANNVLAHVDETVDFLEGIRTLLRDEGTALVEVPYLGDLMDRLEYDTIYHEHLCYFSMTALGHVAERAGLRIDEVERISVHGGSLRLFLRNRRGRDHGRSVEALMIQERERGLDVVDTYRRFARRVAENRRRLRSLLTGLRSEGRSIAGYGAAAKGNTLLNYCDIGSDLVAYVVDLNPLKVGSLTPGTHLPVRPVRTLLRERPDFVLLLAWNFADEILRQQSAYREAGGRFIRPIPEPEVIEV